MIEIGCALALLAIGAFGVWLAGRPAGRGVLPTTSVSAPMPPVLPPRPPAAPKREPIQATAEPGKYNREYNRSSGTGSATGLENA